MIPKPIAMNAALRDPPAVFASPEEVVAHRELSTQQKVGILKQWEYEVREELIASDQSLPGGRDDMLRRILLTLDQVGRRPRSGRLVSCRIHARLTPAAPVELAMPEHMAAVSGHARPRTGRPAGACSLDAGGSAA